MTRLLLYKHKINNIGDHILPKLALSSSQNHLKDSTEVGIKIQGVRKNLEVKRKLRYYKEVISPTLEDQKYISMF